MGHRGRRATTRPELPASAAQSAAARDVRLPAWAAPWLAVLGLTALAGVCYSNSFDGVFVYDDLNNIVDNPGVRQLFNPIRPLIRGHARSLVQWSFAVNYSFGGLDPWIYHLTNLGIHIAAGITLFDLIRRSLRLPIFQERYARASVSIATVAAAIWLLHPLQTQSVTYIVQRHESAMGLCFLLVLYAFLRGATSHRQLPRIAWFLSSAFFIALGVGCKEVIMMAPIVVLWFDRALIARDWKTLLRRRWWVHALLMPVFVGAAWKLCLPSTHESLAQYGISDGAGISGVQYFLNQPRVIVRYLELTFWPTGQCIEYGWQPAESSMSLILPWAVIGSLVLFTLWAAWRRPRIGFLLGSFFLILLPTSSVLPLRNMIAEYRMYLPLAPLAVLATVATYQAGVYLRKKLGLDAGLLLRLRVGLAIAVLTMLGSLTYIRNDVYSDPVLLWGDAVKKSPESFDALANLGTGYFNAGDYEAALSIYLRAHRRRPMHSNVNFNLGLCYKELGQTDRSIAHFERALRVAPELIQIHEALGKLYFDVNPEKAVEHYKILIESGRASPSAHSYYGLLLMKDDPHAARRQFEAVLANDPENLAAQFNMALVLSRIDRNAAEPFWKRVIADSPELADLRVYYGDFLMGEDRPAEAEKQFRKAIELQPQLAKAHSGLAEALVAQHREDEARPSRQEAERLRRDADRRAPPHARNSGSLRLP